MEEHRDEENTEYTGEYGNSIQGKYREDSTYRYSYEAKDREVHSGDYYAAPGEGQREEGAAGAGANAGGGNPADDVNQDQSGAGDSAYGQSWQSQSGAGDSAHGQSWQDQSGAGGSTHGQSQSGAGGSAYGQSWQGQNGAGGSAHGQSWQGQNGAGDGVHGQKRQPGGRQDSLGKKMLVTVACAVVFGLVAGTVFSGFRYFSGRAENLLSSGKGTQKAAVRSSDTGDKTETDAKTESSKQADGVNVASIAEQTMPAVVAITSTTQGTNYFDLFGQYYQGKETSSSGTGFIVGKNDKELLIATNNHVVDNAKTISVQFIDGEIYEAKEKGADSANDLAVVAVALSSVKKTTMDKIKIADMGNSDKAKVGEMVIAIGNALGYGQSVTVGYISAKDREITETDETGNSTGNKIKALQTDAAINPGNSGGALINMQGQVIGINSAKIAASSVEGVGYAIPISVATPIIDELMKKEILSDDEKGYLGITGTEVTEEASVYNMPYGVYVKEVAEGGAAQKGGIKVGDVITAVNKVEVTTMTSLQEKVNSYRKGTKVELTIQRNDNGKYKKKTVTVELQGKESLEGLSDGDSSSDSGQNSDGNNGSGGDSGDSNGNNGFGGDSGDSDGDSDFGSFWDFFN